MVQKGWIYMPKFKIISPSAITDNPFTLIGKDWALVTAGDRNRFNTMTVSWGGTGIMWNKPVTFTFIRPQRYTFGFMEENGCFSMSFFDESFRKPLSYCGSHSGRDVDKVQETGLTPAFTEDGVPYFAEARLVLICKKLYVQHMREDCIVEGFVKQNYNGDDYHRMYVSEITSVLSKE